MVIFLDMVEDVIEIFMKKFLVFWNFFDMCLNNLRRVLEKYIETNLVKLGKVSFQCARRDSVQTQDFFKRD